jgi:hypothetical protein
MAECRVFCFHGGITFMHLFPRIFALLSAEFLLALAVSIVLAICPINWWIKAFLFIVLGAVLLELALRLTLPLRWKGVIIAVIIVSVGVSGFGIVSDQSETDAVIRDYKTTRDLLARFQTHDESLKRIVAQYDRLKNAQSLFDIMGRGKHEPELDSINSRNIEDLKITLNNFDAIATPEGDGLKIKIGTNMYRIIFPVPMVNTPKLSFYGIPRGITATTIEQSNLGFTVLFVPLSISQLLTPYFQRRSMVGIGAILTSGDGLDSSSG